MLQRGSFDFARIVGILMLARYPFQILNKPYIILISSLNPGVVPSGGGGGGGIIVTPCTWHEVSRGELVRWGAGLSEPFSRLLSSTLHHMEVSNN